MLALFNSEHYDALGLAELLQTKFELATWLISLIGKRMSASDLNTALRLMHFEACKVGRFFEQYDVLLTATLARPPAVDWRAAANSH